MKAYYLSLLFLCISLFGAMLSLTDNLDVKTEYERENILNLKNSYENLQPYDEPLDDEVEFQTEDPNLIDRAIGLWDTITSTILPHAFLEKVLRLDRSMAIYMSIPIYLIHLIGLAQLFGALKGGKSAI